MTIVGDRRLLGRMLANLALNALRHNGPDVRVVLGASMRGQEIELFFRDTGKGIPAGLRDQLFEEFTSDGPRDAPVQSYERRSPRPRGDGRVASSRAKTSVLLGVVAVR